MLKFAASYDREKKSLMKFLFAFSAFFVLRRQRMQICLHVNVELFPIRGRVISIVRISKINMLCVNIICLGIHKYLKKFPIMEFIIRKLEFPRAGYDHILRVERCRLIHTHFFNEILMIPSFLWREPRCLCLWRRRKAKFLNKNISRHKTLIQYVGRKENQSQLAYQPGYGA